MNRYISEVIEAFRNRDVAQTIRLSFFASISLAISNIHNFFGTMMIGRIGPSATEQISAMGLSLTTMLLFSAPMNAFGSSVQSLISQLWGKGDRKNALMSFKSAALLSLITGTVMSLILLLLGKKIIAFTAPSNKVKDYSTKFLSIMVIGLPFTAISFVMRGFFDAIGKPQEHLKFTLYSKVFCLIASYLFIFGVIFPRMELYGFALASVLSSALAVIYGGVFIKKYIDENFSITEIGEARYRKDIIKFALKNIKISLPALGAEFIAALSFLFFMWLAGLRGAEHQAVTFVLINILGIFVLPTMAIGMSLAGVVGRLIGKGEIERGKKALKDTVIVISAFSIIVALIFILFPEKMISIFSKHETFVKEGRKTVLIFAPSLFFVIIGMLLVITMIGLGDTKFIILMEISLHLLFFIPSALIVGFVIKQGSQALWTIISGYFILASMIMLFRIKKGNWVKRWQV